MKFRKHCVEMGYKEYTTSTVNKIHDMYTKYMRTSVNLSCFQDLARY